jgi:hypothetical protein
MKFLFLALMAFSTAAAAQAQTRGGSNEWSMHLLAIVGSTDEFEGGAAARNDGGLGVGFSVARNLNNHFAVGVEGTFAQVQYRATVAPGAGNAGAGFESRGTMETAALRAHATWNLLSGPVTPFLTAGAGVIFLDTDLMTDPPANACWFYPWHGQVCSDKAPQGALARLTYSAGTGLRIDLREKQGFVRAYVGGEWIEFSEALSPVATVQFRADFGLRF